MNLENIDYLFQTHCDSSRMTASVALFRSCFDRIESISNSHDIIWSEEKKFDSGDEFFQKILFLIIRDNRD